MRSEQWQQFLILTLFCVITANSLSEVGKCCPTGQFLMETVKTQCMEIPTPAMEVYTLNSSDHRGLMRYNGLPECQETEYWATIPLADVTSSDLIQPPACTEILYDETSGRIVPVLVHCRSTEDRNETDIVPSVSLPEVLEIRQCCPKGSAYVLNTKRCVPLPEAYVTGNISESNENEFLSFLPESINIMDFLVISRGPPKCRSTIYDYEVDETNLMFDNGTLHITLPAWMDASKEERISLSDGSSCLELSGNSSSSKKLVVRACQSLEICKQNSCVRKCCSEDESMSLSLGICGKFDDSMTDLDFHQAVQNFSISSNYGVMLGMPCEIGMYPLRASEGPWTLTSEGYVHTPDYHDLQHHEYCIEIVRNTSDYEEMLYPFLCFDESSAEPEPITHARYRYNATLLSISCMFLLITFLVYVCLPELQNLHGKTLMCHVASLGLAYFCLLCMPWATPGSIFWPDTEEGDGIIVCPLVGYTMIFAFISAFSWLNIMCFDIWWTFGGLRGHSTRGRGHNKKFLLFCTYAWGLPIVLTSLAFLSDKTDVFPRHLRANIGLMSCWFPKIRGFYGEMHFFVGPIILQLIANIVFFILTAIHCSQVKNDLKRINSLDVSDSRSKRFHADRTKLVMNVKLFVVMGLSWSAEYASFFVNKYASNFTWRDETFYLTDSFNCLQGLLIFILFVMKARVYQALRKRFGWDKRKPTGSQGTTALQDPYRIKMNGSNSSNNTSSTLAIASQSC